jgi:hypothetical protein
MHPVPKVNVMKILVHESLVFIIIRVLLGILQFHLVPPLGMDVILIEIATDIPHRTARSYLYLGKDFNPLLRRRRVLTRRSVLFRGFGVATHRIKLLRFEVKKWKQEGSSGKIERNENQYIVDIPWEKRLFRIISLP